MKFTLFVLAAGSAISSAAAAATDPVCIVGAGPAGLTVANGLESKGYETIIFERRARVGGKCQAYYSESGQFHPLGALLYSNETYSETLPLIKALGLPSQEFSYTFKGWLFNWRDGAVAQAPFSPDRIYPLIKDEVERYSTFWETEFAPNLTAIGYRNGIPAELTVPFSQWLSDNKYVSGDPEDTIGSTLSRIFQQGMVPYGYGDISETPAVYMLQYFTPDILKFFTGQHPGYITDFHQLFVDYSKRYVKSPIFTNTNITNIDRSGSSPVITYTNHIMGTAHQTCSKLVLAFPPVIPALEAAHLELSSEEQEVFSPIVTTRYWSGAVKVATPNGYSFSAQVFEPEGQPSAFTRLFDSSPIATTWSWGKTGSNQTLDDVRELLDYTLSKLNKDPNDPATPPVPLAGDDIRAFRGWTYFARYEPKELQDGYYGRFDALQGQLNTYYASGFNGFETVEFAIRAGKDIVDRFFDDEATFGEGRGGLLREEVDNVLVVQ